jgi:hypothetical protein
MGRLSRRYLDVPLNAVLHPVSTEVRKVVNEEQSAANKALLQKWEDIKELVRPAPVEKGRRIWIYGRLIILVLLLSGFFGPWAQISACSSSPTLYRGFEAYMILLPSPLIIIPVALVALFLFTLLRLLPWKFAEGKVLVRLERLAAGIAPTSMGILSVWLLSLLLWGYWITTVGAFLAPVNILLDFNSRRQRGEKWPIWTWLLIISLVLTVSMLFYSWWKFTISTPVD